MKMKILMENIVIIKLFYGIELRINSKLFYKINNMDDYQIFYFDLY